MRFFRYSQNNSGGRFDKAAHFVYVEADSASEADEIAEASGIVYFNGVSEGSDCGCCGDRWSTAYGDGDTPEELLRRMEDSFSRKYTFETWASRFDNQVLFLLKDGTQRPVNTVEEYEGFLTSDLPR